MTSQAGFVRQPWDLYFSWVWDPVHLQPGKEKALVGNTGINQILYELHVYIHNWLSKQSILGILIAKPTLYLKMHFKPKQKEVLYSYAMFQLGFVSLKKQKRRGVAVPKGFLSNPFIGFMILLHTVISLNQKGKQKIENVTFARGSFCHPIFMAFIHSSNISLCGTGTEREQKTM